MDCQATSFVSVTQSDPTLDTDPIDWPAPVAVDISCPAKQLLPQQRQDLAIQVLAAQVYQPPSVRPPSHTSRYDPFLSASHQGLPAATVPGLSAHLPEFDLNRGSHTPASTRDRSGSALRSRVLPENGRF